MSDRELDDILRRAGQTPALVDPQLLDRIAGKLRPSMRPVRPLPSPWILAIALVAISFAVALAGAARSGFNGFELLSSTQRIVIFSALACLSVAAARTWVLQLIPGSRQRLVPGVLLCAASGLLLAVFAALFHDYHTTHFLKQGLVCLSFGLMHAVPTGLAGWFVLRRGFAVQPRTAGVAAGILAGLTGVILLELHCPNFEAAHILFWHTLVVPSAAALGAFVALRLRR